MTEPTDAEIEQLYLEETGFDLNDSPAALLDFARIVLAKWGQPAQAAEPVAWLDDGAAFAGSPRVLTNKAKECMPKRLALAYSIPLYTAHAADSVLEDAMRYRWLREQSSTLFVNIRINGEGSEIAETLDSAVDAARKQGEKQ